jgi:hypothetical protein
MFKILTIRWFEETGDKIEVKGSRINFEGKPAIPTFRYLYDFEFLNGIH